MTPVRMTGRLDPRSSWSAAPCSIAKAVELLSTRSAFLLLREAFYGATRFEEFVTRSGLSEPATAQRLRELVTHGLLEREEYRIPGQRGRQGYVLTEKGAELLPVLVALMGWGDRWLADDGPVELQHRDCGEKVAAELRCAAGHQVGSSEMDLVARASS